MNFPILVKNPRLFHFVGGSEGTWQVTDYFHLKGETLVRPEKISMLQGVLDDDVAKDANWVLHGVTSNVRYVEHSEKEQLVSKQEGLGRAASICAAMILIRKNSAWWALSQDERREVFEAQSQHISIGMKYLPAIARQLHHCRDLENEEPFDFVTWFEFAKEDTPAFNDLLIELRSSPEWDYVDREVDFRMEKV